MRLPDPRRAGQPRAAPPDTPGTAVVLGAVVAVIAVVVVVHPPAA
ncbi:hypothetical protein WME90_33730 [Sorangium sp. So ce375]